METKFNWTKKLQKELDEIDRFIRLVPSIQTLWLDEDVFNTLFKALKYPEDFKLDEGIPYQGKLLKCMGYYVDSIKGSE